LPEAFPCHSLEINARSVFAPLLEYGPFLRLCVGRFISRRRFRDVQSWRRGWCRRYSVWMPRRFQLHISSVLVVIRHGGRLRVWSGGVDVLKRSLYRCRVDKGLSGGPLEGESTQRQCCSRTLSGCHERLSDGHESFDVFRLRIKAVVNQWASSHPATETAAVMTTTDTIRDVAAPTACPTLERHDDDILRGPTTQKIHQGRTTNAADHAAVVHDFQLGRVLLNATLLAPS
jgi:hypothetical protein